MCLSYDFQCIGCTLLNIHDRIFGKQIIVEYTHSRSASLEVESDFMYKNKLYIKQLHLTSIKEHVILPHFDIIW